MDTVRIALAQINSTVGDLAGNSRKIAEWTARAREAGSDIVVFPELALCGYPPEDLLLKPRFLLDSEVALEAVARQARGIAAVVGCPDCEEPASAGRQRLQAYNGAAVILDGRIADMYHKIELPNYGVFDEERYFGTGAGVGAIVFGIKGVPVCVNICEDIWHEGGLSEWHAKENAARIVLNLSSSPFRAGKLRQRVEVIARFAQRTGAMVCYTNMAGGQDELVFDGGSMVVAPSGEVLAMARRFEEELLIVDADTENLTAVRVGGTPELELSETAEVYQALVVGTRDYVRKNGFQKVLVGLSGGIDSAVTAAIAADALGRDNVLGVTMPSQFSSPDTLSDALLLASRLHIAVLTVPIRPVFKTYLETLVEPFGPGEPGIEAENLQARIRGNILMALSNRFGWLVLTTGNKSETAVGYCTLYGDMAGGFAVIKDVPKTLVYKLASHINQTARRGAIPQSIIDRPPTAELKPNQKDTDSLPPYDVLDQVLQLYIEEDMVADEIVEAGFRPELVERVVRMVDHNEYKRRQSPPGVKISPKAFGRDRRLPITNRYQPACAVTGARAPYVSAGKETRQ